MIDDDGTCIEDLKCVAVQCLAWLPIQILNIGNLASK